MTRNSGDGDLQGGADVQRGKTMAYRSCTDEIHLLQSDVVATPAEVRVAALEFQKHRFREAGKHLTLGLLHLSNFHHGPADI